MDTAYCLWFAEMQAQELATLSITGKWVDPKPAFDKHLRHDPNLLPQAALRRHLGV